VVNAGKLLDITSDSMRLSKFGCTSNNSRELGKCAD
jgi:hypothetical protein